MDPVIHLIDLPLLFNNASWSTVRPTFLALALPLESKKSRMWKNGVKWAVYLKLQRSSDLFVSFLSIFIVFLLLNLDRIAYIRNQITLITDFEILFLFFF